MINIYDRIKIGNRLRELREEKKWSQEELGELCEVQSRQTIAKWEHGDITISFNQMIKLCNIFDCDIGYMLCEYDTKHHVAANIQEQTGLSESAINVLQKLGKKARILTDTLSSLLVQPEFDQWLWQIYRIASEYFICKQLEKEKKIELKTMDDPRITTMAESAMQSIVIPELENAELQESKRHHKLIEGTITTLCDTSENIKALEKNAAKNAITAFRGKYHLED